MHKFKLIELKNEEKKEICMTGKCKLDINK